ncbi:MAG: AMP-binding protein, partial [Gammaproteobacteria bacterium]
MSNLYAAFFNKIKDETKKLIVTPTLSYSANDIENYTIKIANILYRLGLQPGDRLAAQIEKSEYNLFLYLACLRTGIIYLPLNNSYTDEELRYFFTDATPKLIVCEPKREINILALRATQDCLIATLDENGYGSLLKENNVKSEEIKSIFSSQPDDIAVILYTSGTTGKPKGAMITHGNLLNNAFDLITVWGITHKDNILHMLPLFHVHGLFFAFHTAMLTGATITLLPKFDPDLFFNYLPQITVFMGVPTYYMRLLKDKRLTSDACHHMRIFISGSAPLLPATFEEFKTKTRHALLERYGMTESGINTSNPLHGKRKVSTVGLPLPGVSVRIVNDENKKLPIDEVGHIQLKGNNI